MRTIVLYGVRGIIGGLKNEKGGKMLTRNRGLMLMVFLVILTGCHKKPKTVVTPPSPVKPEPVKVEEVTPAQPAPVEKKVEIKLERIHFDFDKYDIRPGDKEILIRNAEVLAANPTVKILIEGHCDERGTNEYNMALGEKRAKAARDFLVKYGIAPSRIDIISYGEERPLDPRHNEDAWALNRRAEFVIIEK